MPLLDLNRLIASFREALGWPYVSPGSNDRDGIDCSGMFVRAYRAQGASIYHGSNTIWRRYLSDRGEIHSADQLRPGMAVFKHRTADTAKYPDGMGDFYHIGLVVSTNPPHIIHASTNGMKVREDRWSKSWTHWGYLRDVGYNGKPEGGEGMRYKVTAPTGKTVRVREAPGGKIRETLPIGTIVESDGEAEGDWQPIRYESTGYMMKPFLEEVDQ